MPDDTRAEDCGPCTVCQMPVTRPLRGGRKPKVCSDTCSRERERLRGARRRGRPATPLVWEPSPRTDTQSSASSRLVRDVLATLYLDERAGVAPNYQAAWHAVLPVLEEVARNGGHRSA